MLGRLTGLVGIGVLAGWLPQSWPQWRVSNVRHPGAYREPPLAESSGAIASRSFPGRFWSLNDSGNPPSLFLSDTTARVLGFVRLTAADNVDWEAISAGPCGSAWCLYVGDIGDNRAVRPTVTIYRLVEPDRARLDTRTAAPRESLVLRYPDGPVDAESMVVTRTGDIAIITKGRRGRPTVYWVPAIAWDRPRRGKVPPTTLQRIGDLPIRSSLLMRQLVTDAALSPDEETLAVRTYRDLYLFRRTASTRWLPDQPTAVCSISGLDIVGEGLTWWGPNTLLMTGEVTRMGPGAITLLECRPG
jgi:hypothetical protein